MCFPRVSVLLYRSILPRTVDLIHGRGGYPSPSFTDVPRLINSRWKAAVLVSGIGIAILHLQDEIHGLSSPVMQHADRRVVIIRVAHNIT